MMLLSTADNDRPQSNPADARDAVLVAAFFRGKPGRDGEAFDALVQRGCELLEVLTRHHARTDEEQGDLYTRAAERLVTQLRTLRTRYAEAEAARRDLGILARAFAPPVPVPITHLRGFAGCLMRFVVRDYLLETRPQWRQLYQRLRLLFRGAGGENEFALWTGRDGRLVAGLAPTRGVDAAGASDVAALRRTPEAFASTGLLKLGGDAAHMSPRAASERILCAAILLHLGKPLLFTELIRAVAVIKDLNGVREVSLTASDSDGDAAEWDIVDTGVEARNPATITEGRDTMERLWRETCALVVPERKSLLPAKIAVGTDASAASCVLELFFLSRAATFAQMAQAMERTEAVFLGTVWQSLPWDDRTIAADIPVPVERVRQLRRQARKRLTAVAPLFDSTDEGER